MKNVVIIGVGNLGKRHLEGLMPSNHDLAIYCVDPSQASLDNAAATIASKDLRGKEVRFYTSFDAIPEQIDLAIIATNSKNRLEAVKQLLSKSRVANMILEKVLFPALREYEEAAQILAQYSVEAWVNCPRRLNETYVNLRGLLGGAGKFHMSVFGNKWGMGSNTIHFLDLFVFLAGSKRIEVDLGGLNKQVAEARRAGYVDFHGSITALDDRGCTCAIHDLDGHESSIYINIFSRDHVVQIRENDEMVLIDLLNGQGRVSYPHRMEYQSQLTYKVADRILDGTDPGLTSFHESVMIHEPLIAGLIGFFGNRESTGVDSIAIT